MWRAAMPDTDRVSVNFPGFPRCVRPRCGRVACRPSGSEPHAPVAGYTRRSPCDLIRSHVLLTLYRERGLSDAAFRVAVVLAVQLDEEVLLERSTSSSALSELMDKRIVNRWVPYRAVHILRGSRAARVSARSLKRSSFTSTFK